MALWGQDVCLVLSTKSSAALALLCPCSYQMANELPVPEVSTCATFVTGLTEEKNTTRSSTGSIIQPGALGRTVTLLYIWHKLGNALCACTCVCGSQRSILGVIPQDAIHVGLGDKEIHRGRTDSKRQGPSVSITAVLGVQAHITMPSYLYESEDCIQVLVLADQAHCPVN